MRMDEQMPITTYLKALVREPDGMALIGITLISLTLLFDLLLETRFAPLRDVADPGKAIVLLFFTPLISFLVITMLRQLPSSKSPMATWWCAAACVGTFFILNF